jgi:hypothetical protein
MLRRDQRYFERDMHSDRLVETERVQPMAMACLYNYSVLVVARISTQSSANLVSPEVEQPQRTLLICPFAIKNKRHF